MDPEQTPTATPEPEQNDDSPQPSEPTESSQSAQSVDPSTTGLATPEPFNSAPSKPSVPDILKPVEALSFASEFDDVDSSGDNNTSTSGSEASKPETSDPKESTAASEGPSRSKSTTKPKRAKKPLSPKARRLLYATGLMLASAALLVGGWAIGHFTTTANAPVVEIVQEISPERPATIITVDGVQYSLETANELGTPIEHYIPASRDDDLTLAFLRLHNVQENSCYSPLSIRYALSMIREGTDGESRAQIDRILNQRSLPTYDNVADRLSVANSLWLNDDMREGVHSSYIDTLREQYDASINFDSFASAAPINDWISHQTFGLIDSIIDDASVRDLTAALINALAIDMEWKTQFDNLDTHGALFNCGQGKECDEDFPYTTMRNTVSSSDNYYFNFADEATVFASDLQEYGGTKLQFVAIQPVAELDEYIKNVSMTDINSLIAGLKNPKPRNDTYSLTFTVYIPRFETGSELDLIPDLRTLGVTDIFDASQSNFSKLTDEPFAITQAKHKTVFDFNERGIKAAAVTLAGGRGAAGGPWPLHTSSIQITLAINKPFLYLVRDVDNGEIWFIGTVYEPNHWRDDAASYGRRVD